MVHRLLVGLAALLGLPLLELAWGGPHIHYDDGGNINWRPSFQAAATLAAKTGRPIFIQVSKKDEKNSEEQITMTLRDEKLGKFLNRYFVPVSVDFDKPPAGEVKTWVDKLGKKGGPIILVFSERGAYLSGLSGTWLSKDVEEKLIEMMQEKNYIVPKAKEPEVKKQFDLLEKALNQKAWAKAGPLIKAVQAIPGYSPVKDSAFDLIDKAQADGNEDIKDAYNHARLDEYPEAKKALDKVLKGYPGMPVAEEAKEHLAALKILELANQLAKDDKATKKAEAVKQLDNLVTKHFDTPYAALALTRKKDLVPAPKEK